MRFHLSTLPHTVTGTDFSACAYSQKVRRFAAMMRSLGHDVFHYGAEGSEVDCTEHVDVITAKEQARFFGSNDWRRDGFAFNWNPELPYWKITNMRTASGIVSRQQRGDFVCLVGGVCQKPIADMIGEADSIVVEPFVGYYGVFSKFRVFESYTHQAGVYAMLSKDPNGSLYDAVIPNYYDPKEFPLRIEKARYLLFLARVIQRKGIEIAIATARAANMPLVIAGQGVISCDTDKIVCENGFEVPLHGARVEFVGYADSDERARLMGNATALIQPTIFMEPFGGNVVEAQMCGTPAITTDYAAFSETVHHGVTGYRCHTLEQFVWAARNCHKLDPETIHNRAVSLYSTDRVKHMFEEYFTMLSGLWGQGWGEMKDRENLAWLEPIASEGVSACQ